LGALVGLLDDVPYDNKGFLGFEERAGFDKKEISEGLFVGNSSLLQKKPSVYTSLIQSWLYWGFLHECLQQPVQIEEFFEVGPEGCKILTTKHLEHELVGWAERLQNLEIDVASTCIKNAKDTRGRVEFLLAALSGRIEKSSRNANDSNSDFWSRYGREILPNDLELSICALGYAIDYTSKVLSAELGLDKSATRGVRAGAWYTPPELIRALEALGFCKNDMQHFRDDFGFVTACMAVTLPGLSRRGDHSTCSADSCKSDNIKLDEYERKHVEGDCNCEDLAPKQAWEDMLGIIERGGIPLVRLRPKSADLGSECEFEILPASSNIKYVAYSHVWSDGRGNVNGNGLFACNWRQLQDGAQKCQEKDSGGYSIPLAEMVPFWIDTFCVPRGSGQQVAELRSKAISMMSEIYRGADVVLVLDSALESAGDMGILEFGMRLKFSSWSRRKWTLHEGAVAQDLMFRMAKGLVDLRLTNYRMAKAKYPHRDGDKWRILQGIEEQYIHAVLQGCLMINRWSNETNLIFFKTWRELQKRTTSLVNDRYLVLGIINQVSKELLIELQRSGEDESNPEAARRAKLKSILLSTPFIPQSVVFTLDNRFPELGMQWAPSEIGAEIPTDDNTSLLRKIPGKGAIVNYKGWRVTNSLDTIEISTFLFIQLDPIPTYPNRYKLGLWPTDHQRKNFATLIPSIDHNASLAIIISDIPDIGDTAVNFRRALLVQELGNITAESLEIPKEHSIVHVKYLALLRVYSAPGGENMSH
jgi:hypothetical protein